MKNGRVVGHARTQDVTKDEVLGMIILENARLARNPARRYADLTRPIG